MNDNNTPVTPVMGYLTSNWNSHDNRTPAVVINPEASPVDVLVWCWAEMESMLAAVNVLMNAEGDINKGDFSALIFYRLDPLVAVMEKTVGHLCHADLALAKALKERGKFACEL
jgi:hypothetical protein